MLLTSKEFAHEAYEISKQASGAVGVDFETDGLSPYKGNRAFILGFTDTEGNRFSVHTTPDIHGSMHLFFSNPGIRYCAHNAKFEMGFLDQQFGVTVKGVVYDTEVMARVENNNHMRYGLQSCAQRLKLSKYEPMLAWLKERGNKNAYHKAPAEIIEPYVEEDAWLSWRLYHHQVEVFKHWDIASPTKIKPVVSLENAVLKPLFEMEKQGLLVDAGYCMRAREYEIRKIAESREQFRNLTGVPFVASAKTLKPIFDSHGISYGSTALGNASFSGDSIAGAKDHPIVRAIGAIRDAEKRVSSYWDNFLELEHNGIIHPSIHQNKAQTGRMSISDPSCQNWSTDEDENTAYPIRRAFIARPGCLIASLDYAQMELRKGADEADDFPMIKRIQEGADLHQEVADMAGVARSLAKNGRFAKQYGAGIPRIALTLGVPESVARTISEAIDNQAKAMTQYSRMLSRTCKPYGLDWLGRRFYFDPGFEYKAFNYRIQGGCAEILKFAICDVARFLKLNASPETFMLIPIHDELVLNIAECDFNLLAEVKRIMIAAQRDKKTLAMDVSCEMGPNMYDLEKVAL